MGAVGVRELKNRLNYYLQRARKGEEVIVTERGRPVAVLQSVQHLDRAATLETRLARLVALGIVTLPTREGLDGARQGRAGRRDPELGTGPDRASWLARLRRHPPRLGSRATGGRKRARDLRGRGPAPVAGRGR